MNKRILGIALGSALSLSSLVTANDGPFAPLPAKAPVPKENPMTKDKIDLGRQLYFDPRISNDGTISCNSCHNVMAGGDDNRSFSAGVGAKLGGRNSPTVYNAAFLSVQFWDGRAATLEDQAIGPMINPVEMAMADHNVVIGRLKKIPGYVTQFKKVFGGTEPVTIANAAKAIAAYERTLITPNAPFDKYLRGNKKAISAQAERGYKTVMEVGCVSCHTGNMFAGPELPVGTGFYQKFPTFTDNEYVKKYDLVKDLGRFEATKNEDDKNRWRVPTWRNVALTAPYLHNGSVKTLGEVVRVMAKTQLNKTLIDPQVEDIVVFLNSLTGEFPKETMPRLPPTPNGVVVEG